MSGFRSFNNSTSKRVLNLLELVKLTVRKVMIERERERVTVVKFRKKTMEVAMLLAVLKSRYGILTEQM